VLALELARHDVRVNAVCPGYFATPMNEAFFATARGQEVIQRSIPMCRLESRADAHVSRSSTQRRGPWRQG
jgi:NAD(P)-dependent dehydrogenase (short-subunit alcohol dehydrogenase family)